MQVVGIDVRGMPKGESCHQHAFDERVVVGVVRGGECESGQRWDYSDISFLICEWGKNRSIKNYSIGQGFSKNDRDDY